MKLLKTISKSILQISILIAFFATLPMSAETVIKLPADIVVASNDMIKNLEKKRIDTSAYTVTLRELHQGYLAYQRSLEVLEANKQNTDYQNLHAYLKAIYEVRLLELKLEIGKFELQLAPSSGDETTDRELRSAKIQLLEYKASAAIKEIEEGLQPTSKNLQKICEKLNLGNQYKEIFNASELSKVRKTLMGAERQQQIQSRVAAASYVFEELRGQANLRIEASITQDLEKSETFENRVYTIRKLGIFQNAFTEPPELKSFSSRGKRADEITKVILKLIGSEVSSFRSIQITEWTRFDPNTKMSIDGVGVDLTRWQDNQSRSWTYFPQVLVKFKEDQNFALPNQ